MAELESLDLKVKVKSVDALGELDSVANKLDEIHRKAQRVRNNKVGFDADGDAETIGRAQAVESAVDDVDGETATAHIRTEGGRDVRDLFNYVDERITDFQARMYEFGQDLDFDDQFVTEQVEEFRTRAQVIDPDDASLGEQRRVLEPLERANDRLQRLETELYVDTSKFQDQIRDIARDFGRETDLGGDYEFPTTDLDADIDVDETFSEIEGQLQSTLNERELEVSTDTSVQTQYDLHEQFEETDVESAYADLRGATEGEFDRERTREAAVELEEAFTDVDRPDEAARARDLRDYVGRGEQFISTDQVDEHVRNLRDRIHDSFEDEQLIVDVNYEDLDAPRQFRDVTRTITEEYERENIESVSDITDSIEEQFADTDVDTDAITQRLERDFEDGGVPNVEDVTQTVLQETADVEDDGRTLRDVDPSRLDTDEFQSRVDDLQSDLENRRDLYEGLGVDTDELEQQLTSVDENLRGDIEGGDVDAESLEAYQDQLTEVRQETSRVGRVDTDFGVVSNDLDRLGSQLDEFRTGDRDLTQSLEQSAFRDEIGSTRDDLRSLKSTLKSTVGEDVDIEDSDVWRNINSMEGALMSLDDIMDTPEEYTDTDVRTDRGRHELERRARSFLSLAEREGALFDADTDVQADDDVPTPRSLPDFSQTRMDRFQSMLRGIVGEENLINIRGEEVFDPEDFLGESFSPDDIGPDGDTDFTAEDVFSFDDRDLTDVFESERSFRAYVNPDMDIELGEALASDVELGDLKRESSGLRRQFENLSNVDMSTFYDAAARLIPMLLTFVGALPAAIAGVLTLAGAALSAAGALAAVGALSIGGLAYTVGDGDIQAGLEEIRSQLGDDLESAFAPLATEFDDLGEDALDGVGEFFDVLAAEGYALTEVKDEARAFGNWVFNEVPDAIDDVVALTEVFAPLFGMFGQWLGSTDFAAAFVGITQNILPALLQIVDAFLTMLPTIMQFSQGMLRATGIVFEFWAVIWSAIDALGPFAEWLGLATGLLLSLYSALLLSSWAGSAFATVIGTNAVGAVWAWITSMATAIQVHWAFSGSLLRGVATALWSTVTGFGASVSAAWGYITSISAATAVTYALAAAIAATGIGLLLVGVGALASQFLGLGGDIDEATKSLEDFEDVRSGMDGGGIDNPYEPLGMDAQTAVNPDTSGLNGSTQTAQAPSDGNARDGQTVVDNSTTNVDNSTEMSVENSGGRTRDIGKEIEHTQWRQKSNSSAPYQ